jgi:GMP synthase-like glutamine amidotransferase
MNEWLIAEWKKGTPTLGICYGHQLIAHLHGAKVGLISADGHKLAGLRKIRLQPNALWGGRAQEGEVAVSHQEEVKACPTGFEIVATSREIGIEALAHQTLPIWSFQSHPEATISFLRNRGIADPSNGSWTRFGHSLVQHFLNFVAAGSKKNGDRKDRSPSRTPFSRKSPSRRGKASSRPRGRRSKVRARS